MVQEDMSKKNFLFARKQEIELFLPIHEEKMALARKLKLTIIFIWSQGTWKEENLYFLFARKKELVLSLQFPE